MVLRKTLVALTAAGALTLGTIAVPTSANATPAWVLPVVIAAGVTTLLIGTTHPGWGQPYGWEAPMQRCHIEKRKWRDGSWHRVEVCEIN